MRRKTSSVSLPHVTRRGPTRAQREFIPPDLACSEAELDAFVVAHARAHGWMTYHVLRPQRGPAGFPDRVLVRDDVLAVVELKRSLGARGGAADQHVGPSDAQRAWLDALEAVRWIAPALWRPSDGPRIAEWLGDPVTEPPGFWSGLRGDVARGTTKARPGRSGLVRVNELED